jgi:hypothetical protein
MPSTSFKISIDLSHLMPVTGAITAGTFPHLSRAVQVIAEEAQARWVAYAHGMPMPDGKVINNRTGEYARSIQLKQTGDFSATVFTVLPYADSIETGSPRRDLKTMLSSSLKVRMTHDGRRYLIIPFRWNVPNTVSGGNTMPTAVHDWWKHVPHSESSHIVNRNMNYKRVSGTGAYDIKTRLPITVKAWRYQWGTRLTHDDLTGLGIKGKAGKHMAGMVRFRPEGRKKGGGSKFLTFRIMMEGAKGWIVPAQPGKFPARTVSQEMLPLAEQAFTAAVEADIRALMGTAA